jgi:hypothetical protein
MTVTAVMTALPTQPTVGRASFPSQPDDRGKVMMMMMMMMMMMVMMMMMMTTTTTMMMIMMMMMTVMIVLLPPAARRFPDQRAVQGPAGQEDPQGQVDDGRRSGVR